MTSFSHLLHGRSIILVLSLGSSVFSLSSVSGSSVVVVVVIVVVVVVAV